jgi:hypothetical protein
LSETTPRPSKPSMKTVQKVIVYLKDAHAYNCKFPDCQQEKQDIEGLIAWLESLSQSSDSTKLKQEAVLLEILAITRLPDADWMVRAAVQQRASKALGLKYDAKSDKFVPIDASKPTTSEVEKK